MKKLFTFQDSQLDKLISKIKKWEKTNKFPIGINSIMQKEEYLIKIRFFKDKIG
jgi:hypothetical protein